MEKSQNQVGARVEMVPFDASTAETIRSISKEAYPEYFQVWEKTHIFDAELIARGILDLSFLVRDEDGRFCGYCVAFLVESEVFSGDEVSMYVADVAVRPMTQGTYVGLAIAQEVLARAERFAIERIEFYAREGTTYCALFESIHTQQVLTSYGYMLAEHPSNDQAIMYDAAGAVIESARLMSLEKIITTVDV